MRRLLISTLALTVLCSVTAAGEKSGSPIRTKHGEPGGVYTGDIAYDADAVARLAALTGPAPCVNGWAADLFACDGVDLESFVALTALRAGARSGSNLWGFVDLDDRRRRQFFEFIHAPLPAAEADDLELLEGE